MSRARKRRGGDLSPRRRKSKIIAEANMMKRFFLIVLLAVTATAARITPADRAKAVTVSGPQIAFVSADDAAANEDKNNRAFEIVDDDFLTREAVMPSHLWVIGSSGGNARRVTSGAWSLPIAHPPGPAPSPLSWSPDGKTIAITKRDNPHAKTPNISRVVLLDVASGSTRRLTTHDLDRTQPVFSPDGSPIAYL